MDIDINHTCTILLINEDIQIMQDLIWKLHNKPKSVGFLKADFSADERAMIQQIYDQFDYSDRIKQPTITPTPDRKLTHNDPTD